MQNIDDTSFNKNFLKTLTILYAEDDEAIRKSMEKILRKIFKDVISSVDGKEGLENYHLYTEEMDIVFDAVVTDIRMPNIDGLEMAKKIREINPDIPIIMTTAHGESDYMLEAIKIGVSGYILKPINTKELILTIQKHCEVIRNKKLLIKKEEELKEYVDIIDSIATLCKVDTKDNIIEANNFFYDALEYEHGELIGTNIVNLIHPNSIPRAYKQMKDNIKHEKSWKGKMLFLSKNDDIVPLRATSIPLKDDDTGELSGYLFIGFLAYEEEEEKKEITYKARRNIMTEKQKILQLTKKLKECERLLKENQNGIPLKDVNILKHSFEAERAKNTKLVEQIKYYELLTKELQNRLDNVLDIEKEKRKEIIMQLQQCKREKRRLEDELLSARAVISKLTPEPKYVE